MTVLSTYPSVVETAALRSRLVSSLTGLSRARLQHWHATALQPAHRRVGARGVPRLYSWLDYQRLCVIAELVEQRIPAPRIRLAIEYLDDLFPHWYELSLGKWSGVTRVPGALGAVHVVVQDAAHQILADAAGQMSYVGELADGEIAELTTAVETSLSGLREAGSLFRLASFADAVVMDPYVNAGLPTLLGTRLETGFIAGLVQLSSARGVAGLYEIDVCMVERAVAFEREAA